MRRKRLGLWMTATLVVALAALGFTMSAGAGAQKTVGHTDQGAIGGDFACSAAPCPDFGVVQQLHQPAKVALDDAHVIVVASQCTTSDDPPNPTASPCRVDPDNNASAIAQSSDENTALCPSTWANGQLPSNPAASKGYVCVYVLGGTNFGTLPTGTYGVSIAPGTLASTLGFKINWLPTVVNDSYIDAIWAYNKA